MTTTVLADTLIQAAQRSEPSNAGLQTVILGLIMVVGTALALWLLLKYGNRGA